MITGAAIIRDTAGDRLIVHDTADGRQTVIRAQERLVGAEVRLSLAGVLELHAHLEGVISDAGRETAAAALAAAQEAERVARNRAEREAADAAALRNVAAERDALRARVMELERGAGK